MWVIGKVDVVQTYPLDSVVEAVMMRADVSAFASADQGRQSARVFLAGGDGAHAVGSAATDMMLSGGTERIGAVALVEDDRSVQRAGREPAVEAVSFCSGSAGRRRAGRAGAH